MQYHVWYIITSTGASIKDSLSLPNIDDRKKPRHRLANIVHSLRRT
jgi:hypothetical protein